jgi:deoxyribose-phosphate aldolase
MTGEADLARRVLGLIDLTNLDDEVTIEEVDRLCDQARTARGDVAAVCVWPQHAAQAARRMAGTPVRVATVVNFPAGTTDLAGILAEVGQARADEADEIDVVIPYRALLAGDDAAVTVMIAAVKGAAGGADVKAILETGELPDQRWVARAAALAVAGGADFIKTSTGKTPVSATPEAAFTMLEVIHDADRPVGLKPSGGIRTLEQAAVYLRLADEVMGSEWASPASFRFGASALLDAVLAAIA